MNSQWTLNSILLLYNPSYSIYQCWNIKQLQFKLNETGETSWVWTVNINENDSIIGASQALYKIKKWEWIVPKKFSEQLSF